MAKKIKGVKDRKLLGSREKEILSIIFKHLAAVAVGASLITLFSVLPGLAMPFNTLLKEIEKSRTDKRKVQPAELRRIFEKLKKERLIELRDEDEVLKIILRREGVKTVIVNNLSKIEFDKPKIWDKKWRLIIFDIPEKHKRGRDALVQKLRELNFYRLQKSVFVFPYPSYDIVDFLTEVFTVSPYTRIIESTKIEGEEEILAHFELVK